MRPEAVLRQGPILLWGDVDPQKAAEILEDELGLRPGGGGNYRGPLQTQDETQSAMPARFAPTAQVAVRFWGCFWSRFGGVFAPRAARFVYSPAALRREYPVVSPGVLWGDVDPRQTAEILADELGLRPGGKGNYRGPLQTRDEAQNAIPARFAPTAQVVGRFWGRFGGAFAPRAARFVFSPTLRRGYPVVFPGVKLRPLFPVH